MLTYNYPSQQGTSRVYHAPYGTPIVLNLSIPGSNYYDHESIDAVSVNITNKKEEKAKVEREKAEREKAAEKEKAEREKAEAERKKVEEEAEREEAENVEAEAQKKAIEEVAKKEDTGENNIVTTEIAAKYNLTEKLGFYYLSSYDILDKLYPKMFSTPSIAKHLGVDKDHYGTVNYLFTFTEPVTYSFGTASNMWVGCEEKHNDPKGPIACQNDDVKGVAFPSGMYDDVSRHKNFFSKGVPNIFVDPKKVEAPKDVIIKEFAPLILVNNARQIIDRDGAIRDYYSELEPHLDSHGKMKDCADDDAKCKKFASIMEASQWSNPDTEVVLKISAAEDRDISTSTDIIAI